MGDRPIFVVGPSRSGTALLRAILNGHPDVELAGETHYFDDLRARMRGREQTPLSDDDRARCEDYFLALSHRPYGHGGRPHDARLSRAELRKAADEVGAGADAYFEAFCRLHARRGGASQWGEKTPRHVFRIDDILTRYPEAQIVGMIRDPRAVAASYRDWRVADGSFDVDADVGHVDAATLDKERARRSFHVVLLALLWRSQIRAMLLAAARRPASVSVVRYEDLVADPQARVWEIASWLGFAFRPSMLDVPVLNSSFTPFTAQGGVTTDAVARWRELLDDEEIAAIQSAAGRTMRALGYAPCDVPVGWGVARKWLEVPGAGVRGLTANRGRIAGVAPYVYRRARHLVGRAS
jgi:hypothetical protein